MGHIIQGTHNPRNFVQGHIGIASSLEWHSGNKACPKYINNWLSFQRQKRGEGGRGEGGDGLALGRFRTASSAL